MDTYSVADTFNSPGAIATMVLVVLIVICGGALLWMERKERKQLYYSTSQMKVERLDRYDSSPLQAYKNYAGQLDRIIEDISAKTKSIKDEEIRSYWRDYVQELRVRQLKVLQQIHDREYRELEQKDVKFLTDSDIHSKDAQVQRGIEWAANRSL